MANTAVAFAALVGGAIVIEYGVRSTRQAFAGSGGTTGAATPAATVPPARASGSLTQNVTSLSDSFGWGPSEIADWLRVIGKESGGSLTARNPSSGAYGIAQGITGPSWYAAHGGNATTELGQLTAMANYIKARYGSPSAAWAHELSVGWY
jgi:hypothetical protein